MKIVATTSLPAVDRPNADRWNAARSRQFDLSWNGPPAWSGLPLSQQMYLHNTRSLSVRDARMLHGVSRRRPCNCSSSFSACINASTPHVLLPPVLSIVKLFIIMRKEQTVGYGNYQLIYCTCNIQTLSEDLLLIFIQQYLIEVLVYRYT